MIKEKQNIPFGTKKIKEEIIFLKLEHIAKSLKERGYNPSQQLSGFLISNDPAYISSHNKARAIIQTMDRDEIIEELVRYYLENK